MKNWKVIIDTLSDNGSAHESFTFTSYPAAYDFMVKKQRELKRAKDNYELINFFVAVRLDI